VSDCCASCVGELEKLQGRQRSTLRVVLAINAVMFAVEAAAGILAGSTALLADSLDMLGDALVYGFSLYVVGRSQSWKAAAALAKGAAMALFGLFVLGEALWKLFHPEVPAHLAIGGVGLLALATNLVCLGLLWRHRAEDINMRSVWLCSRNDIVANVSVLVAALGVWSFRSQWPDLLIGVGIAALFIASSVRVLREAWRCRAPR